ncbi:MAG: MmgE/PrpD family protein [Xanthobacteraceae bacterium]|nr:MmgE/PrpD family protein [Xanthobacteraceae bacterium]
MADYVATAPRRWAPVAEREAVRAIVDTVGCMIAGVREAGVHRVLNGIRRWGARGTVPTVIKGQTLDAPWAALVNGTAAHALDFDDAMEVAQAHGSAALVPALLALATEEASSGCEIVDALIVGTEFMYQLGRCVNKAHYAKGWHCTSTIGAPAVAAACARLLRLDADRARNAIALATSLSGGSKCQFGTDTKPLHAGLAAHNGLMAARLAASGVSASEEAFEGRFGFAALMAGPEAPGFEEPAEPSIEQPAIVRPGLWFKLYPCCASAHRSMDALDTMRIEHAIPNDAVERVTASVYEIGAQNLAFREPDNEQQARFSLPYCLATLMLDGQVTLSSFSSSMIHRRAIRDALPKFVMTVIRSSRRAKPRVRMRGRPSRSSSGVASNTTIASCSRADTRESRCPMRRSTGNSCNAFRARCRKRALGCRPESGWNSVRRDLR